MPLRNTKTPQETETDATADVACCVRVIEKYEDPVGDGNVSTGCSL